MTTLTAAPGVGLRPVRWSRLGWVTWRRYRFTLAAVVLVLAALSLELVLSGQHLRSAYDAVKACTPAASPRCRFLDESFHNTYGGGGFLAPVLLLLPGILGAFAGAPLVAKELETGTFRFAWTQGAGRMRWAVSLLLPAGLVLALLLAALGRLVAWHDQPLADAGIQSRLEPVTFSTSGVAVAAWALLGFALGAFAGVAWRRVLPGVASAFGAWFGLAFLATRVRGHYLAPLRTTSMQLSPRNLSVDEWWTKGGARVPSTQIDATLRSLGAEVSPHGVKVHVVPNSGSVDPIQYLLDHGYRQVTTYQPASRYWTLQWIETGWLVGLSVLLLGAAFWLLRRRAA